MSFVVRNLFLINTTYVKTCSKECKTILFKKILNDKKTISTIIGVFLLQKINGGNKWK